MTPRPSPLITTRPFAPVWWLVGIITVACVAAVLLLLFQINLDEPETYPLVTALIGTAALAVAAAG